MGYAPSHLSMAVSCTDCKLRMQTRCARTTISLDAPFLWEQVALKQSWLLNKNQATTMAVSRIHYGRLLIEGVRLYFILLST